MIDSSKERVMGFRLNGSSFTDRAAELGAVWPATALHRHRRYWPVAVKGHMVAASIARGESALQAAWP